MAALALLWLSLWCVCVGLGAAVYGAAFRLGGPSFRTVASLDQLLWVGICVMLAALQLASLAFALTGWVMVALGVLSVTGWPTLCRVLHRRGRPGIMRALVALVVVLSLANSALQQADWYDTVSTHIQQAKWSHEFPIVVGLANLNGKLGFDQAHHLLAAALSFGPFAHRSSHLAVSFLLCSVALAWVLALLSPGKGSGLERTYVALTLAYLAGKAWTNELASLSGDLAMASLLLPAVRELIRMGPAMRRGRHSGWSLLVLGALSGALFAVKFSALPVLVAWVVATALASRAKWRPLATVALLPALLIGATIARRIVLTGWPLYPVPVLALHVPWAVPREQTLSQYRSILAWARLPRRDPHDVLDHGFAHWFVPWFDVFRRSREWALGLVASVALLTKKRAPALVVGTACACVAYWFVGAPDLRFGAVFFWILFAVAVAPLLERERQLTFVVCAALVLWNNGHAVKVVGSTMIPEDELRPTKVETFTRDGASFEINVPTDADLCGDAPLPCSSSLGVARMRRPGTPQRGFLP